MTKPRRRADGLYRPWPRNVWPARAIAAGRACTGPLLLLFGLAACTGAPATLESRPDFEVMTPAGIASVSIRQSPPGMTQAEFTRLVRAGMKRGARAAGRIEPPFPPQRVVWHVDPSASRGMSRLVVNVFNGASPYAYEQDTVSNSAPAAEVRSAVESMSCRLMADMAARSEASGSRGQNATSREDHSGGKS
jgi:hypothetical protein